MLKGDSHVAFKTWLKSAVEIANGAQEKVIEQRESMNYLVKSMQAKLHAVTKHLQNGEAPTIDDLEAGVPGEKRQIRCNRHVKKVSFT